MAVKPEIMATMTSTSASTAKRKKDFMFQTNYSAPVLTAPGQDSFPLGSRLWAAFLRRFAAAQYLQFCEPVVTGGDSSIHPENVPQFRVRQRFHAIPSLD